MAALPVGTGDRCPLRQRQGDSQFSWLTGRLGAVSLGMEEAAWAAG